MSPTNPLRLAAILAGGLATIILGMAAETPSDDVDAAHWAYRPLLSAPPPRLERREDREAARTMVDAHIAAGLRRAGLSFSSAADRRALIRRLAFDLTGLPPSPADVEAFVADASPDAWERLVDRWLALPGYGERQARRWMDLVHFAETHGHDQDRPREHAWRYRDYLVRSFNEDKPYDRFVREQVAGDALYPDDPWATVATGLLAAGPWDESSLRDIREDARDREVGRYLDRDDIVSTVMSTFTSTTAHCARCHDHKFDPITQEEYYGLQAIFAGVDKANRPFDADPIVAARREELESELAGLESRIAAADPALLAAPAQAEVAAWEAELAAAAAGWTMLDDVEGRSEGGATLTLLDDGSFLSSGPRPDKDVTTFTGRPRLRSVTGIRLEVLTDPSLPQGGPGRQDNGNLHLNEVLVSALTAREPSVEHRVALAGATADFDQDGWSIDRALDGDPDSAWGIFPQVGKPHRAVFRLAAPLDVGDGMRIRVELRQTHGRGHLIGRALLSVTDAPRPELGSTEPLPADVAAALRVAAADRDARQRAALAGHCARRRIRRELDALPSPSLVYCGTPRFAADGSFRPAPGPRRVDVLERGDLDRPLHEASPRALRCVAGLPSDFAGVDAADEGARRRALADWLADRGNVLVWRSIANRMWLYRFGRGIVDTPSDFGRMGSAPSHPELLDALAAELLRQGGSLKRLDRLLLTSAAYRQSSSHDARAAALDADNRLLWRMSRRRLDAESIRDTALLLSGDLDSAMGGPSVRQFVESPGVHVTPNVDYAAFDVDAPAQRRRSVYRFLFRTIPDPFMDALDCPDASQLAPVRNESLTALQALALLHDRVLVRHCERFAARVRAARPDLPGQVDLIFREALSRPPAAEEAAAVAAYAREHGLENACRFLLNSNAFLFVD